MMRGPRNWAVAVRKPDGEIAHVWRTIDPLMARHWALRLPVIRGVVALGESLAIGFRALSVSANYAAQEEEEGDTEPAEIGRWALFFSFAVAIGFALIDLQGRPGAARRHASDLDDPWFVLVEGLVRVTVFVGYLFLLSLIPSLRRVFQYHAAEHKAINAFEAGEELTPETVQRYSLIHPRCGTAFLLWVMVISDLRLRPLRPAALVLADRDADRVPAADRRDRLRADPLRGQALRTTVSLKILLAPGLWLQRLTTREPTLDQLEVSIRALREVLEREGPAVPADRRVEVMA